MKSLVLPLSYLKEEGFVTSSAAYHWRATDMLLFHILGPLTSSIYTVDGSDGTNLWQ